MSFRVGSARAHGALALALLVGGCGPSLPDPMAAAHFAAGAVTQSQADLTVRVRALTDEEGRQYFGASTARIGVQPVWIEVRNEGDLGVRYLPILTDPNYFAPQEVAQQLHGWFTPGTNRLLDSVFVRSAMPGFVAPHSVASGFVYTHADGGLKFVNVGLIAAGRPLRFRFVVPIPGREYAVQRVDFRGLYPAAQIEDLSSEQLKIRLEGLPCCVTNRKAKAPGDPLNLVVVGDGIDAVFAFASRGWRLNEPVDAGSSIKMAKAFVLHSQYDTAPVSPLYLFDRQQDVALQKARSSVSRRNHLRLWLAPFTVEHRAVWVGQISRDIGVKLTTSSWYLTTHRISPYVDEERDYLLQDLLMTGLVDRVGFVAGVGASSPEAPRHNLTDDPYYTDGRRLVLFVGAQAHSPLEVALERWSPVPGAPSRPESPPAPP